MEVLQKENKYNIEFKRYSKKLLGYLVFLSNKPFLVLNENMGDFICKKAAYRIHELHTENPEYGMILLYEGFVHQFSPHYMFNGESYGYTDHNGVAKFSLIYENKKNKQMIG